MITKQTAMTLPFGSTVYLIDHFDADGSPSKCRVNGTCRTWKTRPGDFRLPVKRGMREHGQITQGNAHCFTLDKPQRRAHSAQ